MTAQPFFSDWNFRVLQEFFALFPHSGTRDTLAQFLTDDALVSTWIYATVFYIFWRIEDVHTEWRRTQLMEIFIAFCLAVLATLAIRPWIAWPAPSLIAPFRQLYPDYFWNDGNPNCFPSHSTLLYFLVAVGFWPFKRWLSALLILMVLILISLPRIYTGGHYPIDVIAAIFLAIIALWVTRRVCDRTLVAAQLKSILSKGVVVEVFLFLWLFELAEGFRSGYLIVTSLGRALRSIQR